jgi:purine-binding chemotaxis protein CheW
MTRGRRVRPPRKADRIAEPSADSGMPMDVIELPQFPDDFAPGEPTFGAHAEAEMAHSEVALPEVALPEVPFADHDVLPDLDIAAFEASLSEPIDDAAPGSEPVESIDLPELTAFLGASDPDAVPFRASGAEHLPEPTADLLLLDELAMEAGDLDQCVVFWAAGVRFVAPVRSVVQVGDVGRVTFVPRVPHWIAGVVGWRDRVLSLIDLAALLDGPPGPRQRLVVVKSDDGDAAGLLVERIGRIVRFDPASFRDTPPAGIAATVTSGVYGDDPTTASAVLDVDRVLAAAWGEPGLESGAA